MIEIIRTQAGLWADTVSPRLQGPHLWLPPASDNILRTSQRLLSHRTGNRTYTRTALAESVTDGSKYDTYATQALQAVRFHLDYRSAIAQVVTQSTSMSTQPWFTSSRTIENSCGEQPHSVRPTRLTGVRSSLPPLLPCSHASELTHRRPSPSPPAASPAGVTVRGVTGPPVQMVV
jgi:hypothetical protein